ncbi:MAG TPA: DNA sulfur modification protein DndB [Tepidisphaeraceae bacterium]|nr:DNA sulfur modification protein DndB [Tepidisphaeraceae bacterium]
MALKIKNATQPFIDFPALRGSYGRVSYFVTKAGLRDVAENLMLAPQESFSFSERIQRVINLNRVAEEILPYLESNEHRFFNALVCVLLPDREKSQGVWTFEEYTDEVGNSLGGLGKLRITKDVGRVVLDGQHRYEAIRMFWDRVKEAPDSKEAQMEIALMFVVADDLGKVGRMATSLRTDTIAYARNLFAVLNKTARPVDKTTLLLIDDTEFANLATRRLIEDGKIDELYVKWHKTTQNLQPGDPYFTAIHVIKDLVNFYLRDLRDEIAHDLGTEQERTEAMDTYYHRTPNVRISVEDAIGRIIGSSKPFEAWQKAIKAAKVHLVEQPGETVPTKEQGKKLKALRDKELAFTVAGQRAYYKAIIDAFYAQTAKDSAALGTIIKRANKLFISGHFRRKADADNPFSGLLIGPGNRMIWAESSVDCARKIISVALGSNVNQQAIFEEYEALTGLEPKVIEMYWDKTKSLRA